MNAMGLKWILVGSLILSGGAVAGAAAQSKATPANSQLTGEQQKQIDKLKQLDEQLQKDRDVIRDAVNRYGWDSDQADAAQEQLVRDRTEYRQLRRSLEAAGVTFPLPSGAGAAMGNRGRYSAGPGGHGHHGCCGDEDGYCCNGYHDDYCCGRPGK
jgi:hypothetical protein